MNVIVLEEFCKVLCALLILEERERTESEFFDAVEVLSDFEDKVENVKLNTLRSKLSNVCRKKAAIRNKKVSS